MNTSNSTRNFTQIVQDSNDNYPLESPTKKKGYRPDQQEQFHISKQNLDEGLDAKQSPNKTNIKKIIDTFRARLNERGTRGIMGIGKLFRIADKDHNNRLEYPEFKQICRDMRLVDTDLTESDLNDLFHN